MCTVTIVPIGEAGLRMVCNRDELRTRPAALPPVERTFGERRALMPIDPVSDGTWVAINDAGLALTLLNVYERPSALTASGVRTSLRSRGEIIPYLLHASSLQEIEELTASLTPTCYPAFRAVIAARVGPDCRAEPMSELLLGEVPPGRWDPRPRPRASLALEVVSDGSALRTLPPQPVLAPLLLTSSGLGDDIVGPPRRELFSQLFTPGADWAQRQDLFHTHQWPDQAHLSVLMSRPEARTVSRTVVEIGPRTARVTYFDDPASRTGIARTLELQPASMSAG